MSHAWTVRCIALIWQGVYFPKCQTLVAVGAAILLAVLIDDSDGRRKVERRTLEIQRPPITGGNVHILHVVREAGREKKAGLAPSEVSHSLGNICERKVYQAVTTKDQIHLAKLIPGYVEG